MGKLTGVVVTARRTGTAGGMRRQDALVNQCLQTPAAVPDRPLPVFARAPPANVLELTRRVPAVLVLDALAPSTGPEPALVQLTGGCFAAHRQHVNVAQPVDEIVRLEPILGGRLGLTLVQQAVVLLLVRVGSTLLLLLLDHDVGRLEVTGQIADDRAARRHETVVVHAYHRLKVLDLIRCKDVEGSAPDEGPHRNRHLNDRVARPDIGRNEAGTRRQCDLEMIRFCLDQH